MSTITLPYPNFQTGAIIVAGQHNSNNSTIVNDYNGNVTDANIAAAAAIQGTKIIPNFGSQNIVTTGNVQATNIGIGTASPGALLDITSTNGNVSNLKLSQSGVVVWTLQNIATTGLLSISNGGYGTTLNFDNNSGLDIYTNAWADYSATSTIVGWTSFTTKNIYAKKIGKTVIVLFYIGGTSNATSATFTLPYAIESASAPILNPLIKAQDNTGTVVVGIATGSSSTITTYKDLASGSTSWTNSGTKTIAGQFFYQSV